LASATASLEHLWRAQSLPMWLALLAAVFFGLIVLVTLLRAEKSVANGALTVITLLAIGIAAAATIRGSQPAGQGVAPAATAMPVATASLPALSCLDELAGDMVLAACEKVLFGSADSIAAAVSVSAAKLNQLASLGDVARANASPTPDLAALRQSIEHDRYGLFAYVLQARDRCMPEACPFYGSLTDHKQIAANMEGHTYEGLVTRYASGWNSPAAAQAPAPGLAAVINPSLAGNPALAGLPPSVPTGKPTTADFPSAASIPPVSIMTDTPAPAAKPPAAANAQAAPHPAPRKQAAPKARPQPAAPAAAVPLAPEAAEADKPGG
jgi:hypothetical protein